MFLKSNGTTMKPFFFCIVCDGGGYEEEWLYEYADELEVIGNIYENRIIGGIGMKECKHALGGKVNEIGETLLFCELTDNLENVTLGECIGNCESQEREVSHEFN